MKKTKKENDSSLNKRLSSEDVFFYFLVIVSAAFIGLCVTSAQMSKKNYVALIPPEVPSKLEKDIKKLVSNSPIRKMAPDIAKQDEKVAAFLVAIAKKESNWGKYSPKKNGKECYNYWGYRGTYNRTASGYSCFDSPKQAVNIVSNRIEKLIAQNVDTPREMVVWKCGSNCNGKNSYGATKWVQDVDLYFKKIYN